MKKKSKTKPCSFSGSGAKSPVKLSLAQNDIELLLQQVNGRGTVSEWKAIEELRTRLGEQLPDYLLGLYLRSKKWEVRSACVYHVARFARTSESAIQLGLLGVKDKAKLVRYRSCLVLACSQRKDLIQKLKMILLEVPHDTQADIDAAIDAIEFENQNYFVDREHSGMITLNLD